jgi:hypothetical protein
MTTTEDGWTLRRRARGGKQTIEATNESGSTVRITVSHADLGGQLHPVEVSVRPSEDAQQPVTADLMRSLPWEELLVPTRRQQHRFVIYSWSGTDPGAWRQRSRQAVEDDESLAPLARWLTRERPSGGWHEAQFWPALLQLYDQAKEQTLEPTVAVATTLDITPNAARTLIYRARKKVNGPSTSDEPEQKTARTKRTTANKTKPKEVTPPDKE